MNILVIDNYDSFTWNLVQYLRQLGAAVGVARNDLITVEKAMRGGADGLVISPGPGGPSEAGISLDLIAACAEERRPLLGVCLGHQAIGQHFGAKVVRAPRPMHGKTSQITHDDEGVFSGIPSPFTAVRYHSLAIDAGSVPDCLIVSATAEDGTVQALRHRELPINGVQFHPESIASQYGHRLLASFLRLCDRPRAHAA